MERKERSFKGILVSETHWDREWYLTFEEFRKWLVKNIDDLLVNLPTHPEFKSFMLDGQTLPIEDYLEIRPEKESEFKKLVQDGRIVVGPFYVLADEFCESGEGMIRNLLLGHKIAEKYGRPMKVGYVPDTFGHIWQMPQILQGFGIPYMYYFRGYPPIFGNHEEYKGKNDDTPLEHYYQSPDGSKVLAIHHITGYGCAAGITDTKSKIEGMFPFPNGVQRILAAVDQLSPRCLSNTLLLQNGTDHRQAEWDLGEFIEKWNKDEEIKEELYIELEHGTLEEYFNRIKSENHKFPTLTGELRGSMYTQVTPGCISTRMYLKQQNWKVQTELEKYAEPLAALSYLFGGDPQSAFIEKSWKWLLQNHPHDSICGCSVDRVHEDMETRFAWALDLASDVANYALAQIITGVDKHSIIKRISEIAKLKESEIRLFIAFNPNPFKGALVEDYIDCLANSSLKIYSSDGKIIPECGIEFYKKYPYELEEGQYLYKKFQSNYSIAKISFFDPEMPAFGWKVYAAVSIPSPIPQANKGPIQPGHQIETPFYKITLNNDGSLNVFDKETNTTYLGVNTYEDIADDGDEYDYAPLANETPLYSSKCNAVWKKERENDLFADFCADIDFMIPEKLIGDLDTPRVRSQVLKPLHIQTNYRIFKNLKHIEITCKFENTMTGHRLRALIPAHLISEFSYADDHFMVMKRTVKLPRDDGWYQDMQGIYNQGLFAELNNGERGIAVFNRGLQEFEIVENFTPDGHSSEKMNTIAITLMRSVEWLSQKGHLGRKSGLNGPNLRTFGSQCLRKFVCEYAVYPHKGDWKAGLVYISAQRYAYYAKILPFNHRLRNDILSQSIPELKDLMQISNPNIVLSSVKKSWNVSGAPNGIICRFYNPSDRLEETELRLSLGSINAEIHKANLLEQPIEKLNYDGSALKLKIKPCEILTLFIKL